MPWSLFTSAKQLNESAFEFAKQVLRGKSIVIADDNGGILTWLKFTLEDYDAKVSVFKHGKETLDFVEQERCGGRKVDVLILDVVMNEIGGIEIARRVKKNTLDACIIFLTGCNEESAEYCEASRIATVVSKPVGIERLLGIIMRELIQGVDVEYEHFLESHASTCKMS